MSKQVDERVVEMQFDNRQFERNVQTSLNTLDKLKQKLKFTESAKELKALDKATEVTTSGMVKSFRKIQYHMSAMMVARNAAITNLVDTAMNSARRLESVVKDAVIGGGIRRAQNIENAHFQLQGLLKDEEKVKAVMDNAMESVDGTAYAYDEAAKAASQFAASGIQAGEDMKQALRAITGVAAMTNSEYESISRIFTTVAGNGRLMGDQLLQLSSRGMNAAATLATYFGKTEQEIREMVGKGEISFAMFAEAMDDAFGEHAKKANETFNGAISNVKAALARIGAKFFSPLIVQNGTLVKMFNTLRERVNEINAEVDPLAETFVSGVEKIAKAIDDTANNTEAFKYTMDGIKNTFERFFQIGKIAKEAFDDIFPPKTQEDLTKAAKKFDDITKSMEISEEKAEKLKKSFKGLFAALDIGSYLLTSGINFLKDIFLGTSDSILDTNASLGDMIVSLRDWLKEGDRVGKALKKVSDFINKLKNNFKGLKDGTKSVSDIFDGLFDNMSNRLKNFEKTVQQILPNIDINKVLGGVFLVSLIRNSGKITDAITNLTKPFTSFEKTFKSFGKSFNDIGSTVTGAFSATTKEIKTKAILNIAEAIGILAGSLWLLSKVDSEQLAGAAKALSLVIGVIGGLMLAFKALDSLGGSGDEITTPLDKLINSISGIGKAAKQLIQAEAVKSIAVAISIVAGAIAMVANFEPGNVMAAAGAISMLGTVMTGMMAAISKISEGKGVSLKALGTLYAFTPLMALLSGIIKKLAELPAADTLGAAASLSILSGTLTGMFAAFSVIGKGGSATVKAVAVASVAFDAMIGIVGGMVLGIGALFDKFDGLEGKLDKGIDIMGKIGTAIGTFAGNIVGSFSAGAMSGLPEIGNYLTQFIQNAQPFFDGLGKLNPDSASAVKDLVLAMGFLAAEDFISNLTKFTGLPAIFGSKSSSTESFTALGEALKAFGDATAGISNEQITSIKNSAEAIKAVVEVANVIPNEGGWISKIVGDNKMGDFGPQMKSFGESLKEFGDSVVGLKTDAITNAIEPARSMIEIAELIPNSGGLFAEIAGDNNIAMFGLNLASFGDCLVRFGDVVKELKAEAIMKAKEPMQAMIELAQMVPMLTEGTAAGFFGGDNSLNKLGTNLIQFADKLKSLGDKLNGINITAISSATPAMSSLIEMTNNIPAKRDFKHLKKFGKQLVDFAEEMSKFSKKFNIDSGKIQQAKTTITDLSEAFANMDSLNTSAGKNFTSALKSLSKASIKGFSKDISKEKTNLEKSGTELINSLMKGIDKKKSDINTSFSSALNSATSSIRNYYSQFYSAGSYLVDGFANAIRNNASKAVNAASQMGSASENALKKSLDEHSPSKKTELAGAFFVQGYVNALGAGKDKVKKVSSELGTVSMKGLFEAMNTKTLADGLPQLLANSISNSIKSVSKSMAYGNTVLQKFYDSFLQGGKKLQYLNTALNASAKAISAYGKQLYKESSYYEQDNKNLKEHKKELADLKKKRNSLQKDLKKSQNGTLKNSKKTTKQIQNDIKTVNKSIKEANKQIKQDQKDIAEHTKQVFNDLRDSLAESVKSFIDPFTQSLENGIDLFSKFETSDSLYAQDEKNLRQYESDLESLTKQREELQNEITRLEKINTLETRNQGKRLENTLEEVEKKIEETTKNIEDVQQSMAEHSQITVQSILENMQSQVDGVTDWNNKLNALAGRGVATGLLEKLKEMGPESADYVNQFMKMTNDEITKANELFAKSTNMTSQTLLDNFQASLDKASAWANGMTELANRGFSQDILEHLGNMGPDAYEYMNALLTMTPEQQAQFQQKYASYLSLPESTADTVMASYVKAGADAVEGFTAALDALNGKMLTLSESLSLKALDGGLTFGEALSSGISKKKTKVKDSAKNTAKSGRKAAASEMSSGKGQSIGKNFDEGIAKGISDNTSKITYAAKQVASSIPTSVRKILGIKSPSRVAAVIGKYFDLGLIKGFNGDADEVRKTAVKNMTDVVSAVADSIDTDTSIQPKIRPVIDYSEIQNGRNTINGMMGNLQGSVKINSQLANDIRDVNNNQSDTWAAINNLGEAVKQLKDSQGVTITNEFNIDGAQDPRAVAQEVSAIIQRQVDRRTREWA